MVHRLLLAGNTIDASGGTLEVAGTHSLNSITTNDQTKLQINNSANISRTDSGTSTIGDLEIIVMQGYSGGNSLSASNMDLTIAGTVALDSQHLTHNNGILTFS